MKIFLHMRMSLVLLFTASITLAHAHKVSIKGTITDSLSGEVIPGVVLHVTGTGISTNTDMLGNFLFADLQSGKHTLRVSYLGYSDKIVIVEVTEQSAVLKVKLNRSTISLSEVEVIESCQLNGPSPLSKIDLSMRPVGSSQDLLRTIPGLVTEPFTK